jgi:hypothetical protein
MVFLALTKGGYEELLKLTGTAPTPLWVGDGVITYAEMGALHAKGVEVSNFNQAISPYDSAAIESALETINQHHPGEAVWVERRK